MTAKILSIQVGKIRKIDTQMPGKTGLSTWTSGFFKEPVDGMVRVHQTHVEGDAQADRRHHGGPDKAVYAYPSEHYPWWGQELSLDDTPYGGFGENLTTSGLLESEVCIGDIYQIGEVQLQVSEPRRPCWKISLRWQRPDLMKRVETTGRTGWYLRVLQEGTLEAGMEIKLVARLEPEWIVARAYELITRPDRDLEEAQRLAQCECLPESFREELVMRIQKNLGGQSR